MPPKILKQPSTKASRVNSLAIATIAFFMGIFVFFLLAGGPLLFREQHKSHIYVSPDTEVLAAIEETGVNRLAKMECGLSEVFPGCSPEKDACGRGVIDDFASPAEIAGLRRIAETAFKFGGGSGPPSIFDLASGALSHGTKFVNFFAYLGSERARNIFEKSDIAMYEQVLDRVRLTVLKKLGSKKLWHVGPNFFSRINSTLEVYSVNDEYFHWHIDRNQYKNFDFTALIYLSDFGDEFSGGEFAFLRQDEKMQIVHPKKGRLLYFTSGKENVHKVAKVNTGVRWALTVAFTCDESKALKKIIGW